jgi:hypothetical protein
LLINFEAPPPSDSESGGLFDCFAKSPERLLSVGFQLAALGGATAFALAGVLALTAPVTGLAAALPFTGVLSFAGVRALVPHRLERNSRGSWFTGCEGADCHRSGHQTGNSGARKECFRCIHLVLLVFAFAFLSSPSFGKRSRREAFKVCRPAIEVALPENTIFSEGEQLDFEECLVNSID